MTKLVVIACGAALAVVGLAVAWQGYSIVELERGWAATIAGATAMTGGFVIMAIGCLIDAVERLRLGLPASAAPTVRGPAAPAMAAEPAIPKASPPRERAPKPSAAAAVEEITAADPPEPQGIARATVGAELESVEPPPDERVRASEPSGKWIDDALMDPAREPLAAPNADEPSTPPKALAIVGRYAFGGANYALFEDGSIETQTATGVKRFASLAELREHIGGAPPQR